MADRLRLGKDPTSKQYKLIITDTAIDDAFNPKISFKRKAIIAAIIARCIPDNART
jgi:hypothetical protein